MAACTTVMYHAQSKGWKRFGTVESSYGLAGSIANILSHLWKHKHQSFLKRCQFTPVANCLASYSSEISSALVLSPHLRILRWRISSSRQAAAPLQVWRY